MYTRILSIILPVLIQSTALGQCEPLVQIKSSGFGCDNIGELCVFVSLDLACNTGLTLEIEYDETGFDLHNWDHDITQRGTNLVLSKHPAEGNHDDYGRWCLSGELLDDNLQFTIRILDGPNLIHEVVRGLKDHVTVGNSGTKSYISDLTSGTNPILVPYPSSLNEDQRVIVKGELVIDTDYGFGRNSAQQIFSRNEIIMMPGSSISIEDDVSLYVRFSTIEGCDDIWDGISLNNQSNLVLFLSDISDAVNAIHFLEDASADVFATNFVNNESGIRILNTVDDELRLRGGIGSGSTNFFTTTSNLFSNSTGVEFHNTANKEIFGVNFNDLFRGINCSGLDSFVFSGSYIRLQEGIRSIGVQNTLTVQGAIFRQNYICIIDRGSSFSDISDINVNDCTLGYFHYSNAPHYYSQLSNSVINTDEHNVLAIERAGRAEVEYNTLSSSSGFNTFIAGLGYGEHKWAIQNNHILFTESDDPNTFLRRTNFARIHENEVLYGESSQCNIHVLGGLKNVIGCNYLINDAGNNVNLNGSPRAQVYCNSMDANGVNMFVGNNCGRSEIRVMGGPNINSSTYNLEYDDRALTGHQVDMGNKFELSSQGNEKAIHHGDQFLSELSQYIVPIWAFQGDEDFPFFISASSQWFNNTGSIPSECGPSGCLPGFGGNPGEDVPEIDNANTLYSYLQSGLPSTYGAEIEFDVEFELMKNLHVLNDDSALSGNLLSYYNSNQSTEAYKLSLVEHNIANSIKLSSTHESQLDNIYNTYASIQSSMSDIVLYSIDSITGEVIWDSLAIEELDSLHLEIDTLNSQLQTIRSPYLTAWYSELSDMQTYNSNISTTTTSGANLKAMNDVYIRYSISGEHELNSTDLANVEQVAAMCYLEGGEGVLLARNLEAAHLGYAVKYNDNCNQVGNLEGQPTTTNNYIGVPNPSDGQKVLITSTEDEPESHEIEIIDMSGQVMFQTISEKEVDLSFLPPGVYYIRGVQDEGSAIRNGRIVITSN